MTRLATDPGWTSNPSNVVGPAGGDGCVIGADSWHCCVGNDDDGDGCILGGGKNDGASWVVGICVDSDSGGGDDCD